MPFLKKFSLSICKNSCKYQSLKINVKYTSTMFFFSQLSQVTLFRLLNIHLSDLKTENSSLEIWHGWNIHSCSRQPRRFNEPIQAMLLFTNIFKLKKIEAPKQNLRQTQDSNIFWMNPFRPIDWTSLVCLKLANAFGFRKFWAPGLFGQWVILGTKISTNLHPSIGRWSMTFKSLDLPTQKKTGCWKCGK